MNSQTAAQEWSVNTVVSQKVWFGDPYRPIPQPVLLDGDIEQRCMLFSISQTVKLTVVMKECIGITGMICIGDNLRKGRSSTQIFCFA